MSVPTTDTVKLPPTPPSESLQHELLSLKQTLAAELITQEEFSKLRQACLHRHMQGTTPDQAVPKTEDLAAISWDAVSLSRKSAVAMLPWAPKYVDGLLEVERIGEAFKRPEAWDELRAMFVDRARHLTLAPVEIVLLSQVLCEDNKERAAFFIANLILCTAPEQVYTAHNVDMLRRMHPSSRRHWAGPILGSGFPAYPPIEGHDLNAALRRGTAQSALVGGGVPEAGCFGLAEEPLEGGAYFAPLHDKNGDQIGAVDLSVLESYLNRSNQTMFDRIGTSESTLRKLIADAKRRQSTNRGGRGRHAGGGSGRGRGHRYYGGSDPEPVDTPKNE